MMQGVAASCGGLVHPMSPTGIAVQTQTHSQLALQQPQQPAARAWSGLGAGVSGCSGALQTSKATRSQRRLGSSASSMMTTALSCAQQSSSEKGTRPHKKSVVVKGALQEQEQEKKQKEKEGNGKPKADAEETTRKLGLEAGLWQIFTAKEKTEGGTKVSKTSQAKDLLTRYGGAYLITSITLSLISFGLCYVLINNGVDVPSLLEKVGIQTNETGEKVGTFALAYAAHKAASPIRFPPTVALTPIVAGWFGKKQLSEIVVVEEEKGEEEKKP